MPALIAKTQTDEEQDLQPQMATAQGGTMSGGTGGPQSLSTGSGQFTNFQKYVQANKPQTERMARNIMGNVESERAGLRTKAGETYKGFQSGLQQQGLDKESQAKRSALLSMAGTNPLSITGNALQQGKQSIEAMKAQQKIQAPQDVSNQFGQLSSQGQNIRQEMGTYGTEAGRQAALGRVQGSTATGGINTLNRTLLGMNPAARGILTGGDTSNQLQDTLAGYRQNVAGDIERSNVNIAANRAALEGLAGQKQQQLSQFQEQILLK